PREVLCVMAHEMGHYVLGHVVRSILLSFVVTLAGLYFVHRAAGRVIAWFRGRLGFDELRDVASVPLVLLGQRVLLVDDVLATGGTAGAAVALLRSVGATVVATSFLVELVGLGGRSRVPDVAVSSIVTYD
ncbi:MAG TPA: phosphoribosyltransferase family protein, partial [Microthrixaceae bacterium]|nr:phosphoribosyltransferase family protein [Microthrixaceae bacterium]